MKKERAIIIKNPRLRRIRNELRNILQLWIDDIWSSLTEQIEKHNWDDDRSTIILRNRSELCLFEELSICLCLHCGHRDKDMIYRPDMRQWLCIECNSEIVYYDKLRNELQMNKSEIEEFFNRLKGGEGIGITRLTRSGIKCGGDSYPLSRAILTKMGISPEIQDQFLRFCRYYGGHCDCEIWLNSARFF